MRKLARKTFTDSSESKTSRARDRKPAGCVSSAEDKGKAIHTAKHTADLLEFCGAGAWIKLLRAYKVKNALTSWECTTSRD